MLLVRNEQLDGFDGGDLYLVLVGTAPWTALVVLVYILLAQAKCTLLLRPAPDQGPAPCPYGHVSIQEG
jgi:hypothetical protein